MVALITAGAAAVGGFLAWILRFIKQRAWIKAAQLRDAYDRQETLMDRMQVQIDAMSAEMSRRLVVEQSFRDENAELRARTTYLFAVCEQYYFLLMEHKVEGVMPLPERPVFKPVTKADEFEKRTREQNVDLISTELKQLKKQKRDSDKMEGKKPSPIITDDGNSDV